MAKKLTDEQEQQVLKFIDEGLTIKQLSERLGVSKSTVSRILKRLNLTPNYIRKSGGLQIIDGRGTCKKCCETKEVKDFSYCQRWGRYLVTCKTCWNARRQERRNTDIFVYFTHTLNSIKHRDKNTEFTKYDLLYIYKLQDGLCFYTGEELIWGSGNIVVRKNSLSVDKIVPDRGYVKGNVVLCCNWINTMKQDASLDTLKIWMPPVYEKIQQGYRDGVLY